jgi:hypothetical protein
MTSPQRCFFKGKRIKPLQSLSDPLTPWRVKRAVLAAPRR